jgi:hypothetical protein
VPGSHAEQEAPDQEPQVPQQDMPQQHRPVNRARGADHPGQDQRPLPPPAGHRRRSALAGGQRDAKQQPAGYRIWFRARTRASARRPATLRTPAPMPNATPAGSRVRPSSSIAPPTVSSPRCRQGPVEARHGRQQRQRARRVRGPCCCARPRGRGWLVHVWLISHAWRPRRR